MDSLTQITLGAAMAEAVAGRRFGNKAIFWGAACGTIPDLDVFISYGGAVEDFTFHRGFTHSIFVLAALAPVLAFAATKLHKDTVGEWRIWLLAILASLLTHPLLDCFTVYGTQILWPIEIPPVSWSTIFIIDPLYTLPMAAGVLAALFMTRATPRGHRAALAGIAISTAYLGWTVAAKFEVERIARASLAAQGIAHERLLTTPAPFNSLLWRILAMNGERYYEGYYSVLDPDPVIRVTQHTSRTGLLSGIESHWPVQRLQWFTHGFNRVGTIGDNVVITDLRMGIEGAYTFAFKVGERIASGRTRAVTNSRAELPRDFSRLGASLKRIWDPTVELTPSATPR